MSLLHASGEVDLFALSDFWKPSTFSTPSNDIAPYYGSDLGEHLVNSLSCIKDTKFSLAPTSLGDGDLFAPLKDLHLRLPNLEDFQFGPLETLSKPESSPSSIELEEDQVTEPAEDDIWQLNPENCVDLGEFRLKTWETFENATHTEPCVYLSEAGPRAFDDWLASSRDTLEPAPAGSDVTKCRVRADPFLKSLLSLGLGTESAVFKYDIPKKSFGARLDGLLVSGYSSETINSVTQWFIDCGNKLRVMDTFIQKVHGLHSANSTTIAFAQALSATITHLRAHILATSGSVQSMIQLQALFSTPFTIVSNLQHVLEQLHGIKAAQKVLTILFDYSQKMDDLNTSFRPILLQIMARASVPWLRSLESALGLRLASVNQPLGLYNQPESDAMHGVEKDNEFESSTGILSDEGLPLVREVSQSLLVVQAHMPNHILSRMSVRSIGHLPSLEWGFGWKDMERIQAKANMHERRLLEAMSFRNKVESSEAQSHEIFHALDPPFDLALDDAEKYIAVSQAALELPLPDPLHYDSDDTLAAACHVALSEDSSRTCESTPPLAVIPSVSFSPIIAAQARLVNLACLRMVFIDHKLQQHFSLQRRFHLFGDGVFASRLSNALFNPELPTSQRRKGCIRDGTVGLNLGFRNSWPPATSELRLALMGILKDCFRTSDDQSLIDRNGELPGGLSFSIRNLSEEQIQKCLDPNSVEALDFLRLLYHPPPPLDTVFTQSCLDKYDQIFKVLLRVARMIFVVNDLHLDRARHHRSERQKPSIVTERFRMDAHHFVSTLSAYFLYDGISPIWSRFASSLDRIASRITGDVQPGNISEYDGLHQVREIHERVLDHIMFALLSRRRQEKAMQLLEDVFRSILLFAKESRATRRNTESTVDSIYQQFKTSVGAFILLCREMSMKKGLGAKNSQDNAKGTLFSYGKGELAEENTLGRLLLKLEMNGYYGRFCKAESSLVLSS